MNPGDPILLEAPLYAGVLPYLQSIDAEMIGKSPRLPASYSKRAHADHVEVDVDSVGMSSKRLEEIMSNWPEGKQRPKVL